MAESAWPDRKRGVAGRDLEIELSLYFGILSLRAERKTEMEYTAVIKKSGEWWIGWIEEVPGVNCQEPTREELRLSLAETLAEALEFNRQDARAAAGEHYFEEKVAIA